MLMLELRHVSLRLREEDRTLVEDLSFTLARGDRAVLIGEEGNGKSTLLRAICDRAAVERYCEVSGEIVSGRPGYLSQMLAPEAYGLSLAEYFADADWYGHIALLDRMGLSPEFLCSTQRLGTLSGGERVKARLCRLLLDDPDVLLLDEPTNDLDVETLEWLENFLCTAKQSVLYVSHDETLIERTANVILHLEQLGGKRTARLTVSRRPYREYLAERRSNFAHQEQVAQKQRDDYDRQMQKWRQIRDRVDHEQRVISRGDPSGARLLKKKMHAVQSMGRRFDRQKEDFIDFPQEELAILARFDETVALPAGKTVLDLSLPELRAGERLLVRDVALHVNGGEIVGITGRNGAGKSTLLAAIWAQLRDRTDVIAAYMPQDYTEVLPPERSPVDFLARGGTKEEITRARTYLGSMRFTRPEMVGRIGRLSGGQQAKLLFLDMVLRGANVLLLDEPTRNFSPLSAPVVRAALAGFGGTIISVSHDRKYLSEVCDTVYELTETGLKRIEP